MSDQRRCTVCKEPLQRRAWEQASNFRVRRMCGPKCRGRFMREAHQKRLAAKGTLLRATPIEPARQKPLRLGFALVLIRSVVIAPPIPAPVKYDVDGHPCLYQDDLTALADHGSMSMPTSAGRYFGNSSLANLRGLG